MQLFKKTLIASALLSMGASVQAEVSANIGVTSDYLWRGVSQSGGDASVSGGIDYADESGFYAGTWVGSLGGGGSEVDLYGGYATDLFDVGYIYYWYPSAEGETEFGELYGSVTLDAFTLGAAYTVNSGDSNENAAFDDGDLYIYGSYGADLGDDWSLGLTLGSYMFDHDDEFGNGELDYLHYSADLSKTTDMGDFTFTLSDTDIDDDDIVAVVSWVLGF